MPMNPKLLRPKATASVAPPSGTSAALLLRFDGANESTTFTDSSPAALSITAGGDAEISTAQSKYGGSSGLFVPSSYVYGNVTFDWSSDWTLELWFRRAGTGTGSAYSIFEAGNIQGGVGGVHLQLTSGNAVRIDDATASAITGAAAPINEWIHIAVVRDGGVNYLFIDGVLQGSATFTFPVASTRFTVGAAPNYGFYANGYIDDLRLTPIAVYDVTQCFDPPAAALPATGIEPVAGIPCPEPADPPSAITDLGATAGDGLVDLSWTAPSDNGAAITDYIVEYSSDYGTTWTTYSDGTSTATTASVGSLTNDTQYYFRVAAVNSAGTGDWSNTPDVTPVAVAPDAPTDLTATPYSGYIQVSWTAPANVGSRPPLSYEVEYSTDGGSSTAGSFTSATAYGDLTPSTDGTTYYFRVRAAGDSGTLYGAYTDWSAGYVYPIVPDPPGSPAASGGDGQVTLSWSAPFDGGSPITGYAVERSDDGTTWSSLAGAITDLFYTDTTVNNGSNYFYRVNATNAVGNSNWENTDSGGGVTPHRYGCMDSNATNYDSSATADDGSCTY